MYKLAIKFLVITLALTGACLMLSSDGKASAATTSCPAGDSVPADWGNDNDGEGAGVMSSLVMRARDASGNSLDPQFTLQSQAPGWPDNAQIYRWPIGSGGSVSNTDAWPQHGDFQFGTHLSGDGGISCDGWIVMGPGVDGNVGNGWVLNCKNGSGSNNTFWISHVDNPGGQAGQWWLLDSGNNVLDTNVNSGTNPHINFPVTNGANMRFTLVWHPAPPTWSLSGDSRVDGHEGTINVKPNTSHTFTHTVTNTLGSPANYAWSVVGNVPGGKPAGTENNVGEGGTKPNPASDSFTPTPDMVGNTYCEHIQYSNATGPGTPQGSSSQACVYVTNSGGTHTLGCSETTYKVSHQGGHRQYIQLTGTDSDGSYYVAPDGSGNDSIDLNYTAIAPTIHVLIHRYTWNGSSWVEDAGSPADHSYGCYHAACSQIYYDGDGPWDGSYNPGGSQHHIVQAGHGFKVFVSVVNNNGDPSAETIGSSAGGYSFSMTEPPDDYQGGFAGHGTGFDLNVGETQTKEIDFAPNSNTNQIRDLNLSFYPDYYGYGALGEGCSASVRIYQQFNASVSAKSNLAPTTEHPSSDQYSASANFTWVSPPAGLADHGVNDTVSASFYQQATSGARSSPCSPSSYSSGGPFTIQSNPTVLAGNCSIPAGSYQAGDEFCTTVSSQYSSGYVGPDNGVVAGAGPATDTNCPRVVNEPYFKVYNSDISAGGEFDKCTTDGGTLAGYADISDPSGATRGSTTQLSALALLKITGVASAKTAADITGSPTKLTFANTGVQVDSSGNESPVLGGQFGGCRTLTNETAPASAKNLGGGSTGAVPTAGPGAYTHTGNLTITGGTLGVNQNVSIFVTGNVYISNDITYGNGWQAGTAPSFTLHATGNIYIAPGVKQLAGVYLAQSSSAGAGGKIYTCADSSGFAPMSAVNLYNGCKNQLVVYGSFVADQVNLMRSFGSLRDEIPSAGSPGSPGAVAFNRYQCNATGDPALPHINFYQIQSSPPLPANKPANCSHNSIHTDGYIMPSPGASIVGVGVVPLYYGHKISGASAGDNFYTTSQSDANTYCGIRRLARRSTCDSGQPSIVGYVYAPVGGVTPALLSTVGLETLYMFTDQGYHFYTTTLGEGGATTVVGYVYNTDGGGGAPAVLPSAPGAPVCSNLGGRILPNTCAGEIFEYSPALYLSNGGGVTQPPGGGSLQLQSITSLPPVL